VTSTGEAGRPDPAPGTVAWFHCFAGIAGDMALGSLLDAGAGFDEVLTLLRRLPLDGWRLEREDVLRGGIACTRAVVTVDERRGGPVTRTHGDIAALVGAAALPDRVAERALGTFRALAEVEGRLHRRPPDQVHLHEVGGHDAIVDVVGAAAAMEVLDVGVVVTSAVALGTGTVRAAHGILPNPPPAVVRLLEGIPSYGRPVPVELTTPTGAALVRHLASSHGPMPAMTVTASGYGAGTAELDDLPNCTQVVVGRVPRGGPGPGQPVTVLETNLDDATGEQLAYAISALLGAGAHDAWVTPVVMKKGRPGHTVHVLCDPSATDDLRRVLRQVTGTFGIRATAAARWPDARTMAQVIVAGEPVRMKVGPDRAKPEPDDVARVAARTGLALREVASLAEEAWRHRADTPSPSDR
jgi:pyridinium-3,5-bisthiocarboxylic acid mononucleotide nickel chelatase